MTDHDEALESAREAWRVSSFLKAAAGGSPVCPIAFSIDAYLAAMLERGWKMCPRAPDRKMLKAYSVAMSGNEVPEILRGRCPPRLKGAYRFRAMWDAAPSPSGTGGR